MQSTGQDRAAPVRGATAIEAIATWLEGHYQAGDEPAMLRVIRREICSELSDAEIKCMVYEASEQARDATAVLARLREADHWEAAAPSIRPSR